MEKKNLDRLFNELDYNRKKLDEINNMILPLNERVEQISDDLNEMKKETKENSYANVSHENRIQSIEKERENSKKNSSTNIALWGAIITAAATIIVAAMQYLPQFIFK